MPLFLKITTPRVWTQGDFTADSNLDINMTVYREPQFTNTVDLTTYSTITMRLIDPNHNGRLVWDSSTGVSGDANGILTWQPTSGATPHLQGLFQVRPRFEKSGEKITGIGVAGTDEIFFKVD